MKKVVGATCLVAGTAIGAGMIALPMTLAKLGLVASVFMMVCIWAVMYFTSLVSLELNLQSGRGMPLGDLAQKYSGRWARGLGYFCFMLLCYALLSAYIYGGGATLVSLVQSFSHTQIFPHQAILIFGGGLFLILLFSLTWVDYINRILFIKLMGIFLLVCVGLFTRLDMFHLPLMAVQEFSAWKLAVPVAFTSFGFQVIFHTLTDYCKKDKRVLKKAFFWGSLIPMGVYLVWTACVLGALSTHNPDFYVQVVKGGVDVGDLMHALSLVAGGQWLQIMVWGLSTLAILTSAIGVCLGLIDEWKNRLKANANHLLVLLLCLVPPVLCAWMVPGAFIKALSFAGMILVVIAILLPLYLFCRGRRSGAFKTLHYPSVGNRFLQGICLFMGLAIMLFEAVNLFLG